MDPFPQLLPTLCLLMFMCCGDGRCDEANEFQICNGELGGRRKCTRVLTFKTPCVLYLCEDLCRWGQQGCRHIVTSPRPDCPVADCVELPSESHHGWMAGCLVASFFFLLVVCGTAYAYHNRVGLRRACNFFRRRRVDHYDTLEDDVEPSPNDASANGEEAEMGETDNNSAAAAAALQPANAPSV